MAQRNWSAFPTSTESRESQRAKGLPQRIAGRLANERSVLRSKDTSHGFDQPIKQSFAIERRSQSRATRDTTVPRPSSNLSLLPPYSTDAGIRAIDMSGCAT